MKAEATLRPVWYHPQGLGTTAPGVSADLEKHSVCLEQLQLSDWRLAVDARDVGLSEHWFEAAAAENWQPVRLPAATQSLLGEACHDIIWLRTEVTIPDDWPHAVTRLRFDAVATEARIWVNGEAAGEHTGDYLPFDIDITRWVRPGDELHVVVRVDELPDHITKGFHDLTSVHHGGIWQPVRLIGSGRTFAVPDGVAVTGMLAKEQAIVHLDLAERAPGARVCIRIEDPAGAEVRRSELTLSASAASYKLHVGVPEPTPWSPDRPQLYTAHIELHDEAGLSEVQTLRFGFRDVRPSERHILLNGKPIFLSGILHWGHEPEHLAPAPPPEQVRGELARLKEMGFNCVCLCMWYPPEHFFEIADEMGMLIWQEHPVWQSRMDDADVPEYQRNYRGFLRRDRKHTAVVIVSATCEHPNFHRGLADWWWRTARGELPSMLLQLQTASFAWADHARTDLHDEHTYDNNDRWPCFLADLQDMLATYHAKPFVMGESILFHSWPDLEALGERSRGEKTCYLPDCFESMQRLEQQWGERYGASAVRRFREQADRHHLQGRKFQFELFRRYANHAGLVMNHLIDVHQCACGFMDALGRWRFDPEETRPWLSPAALLLRTPGERRFFAAGEAVDCDLLLSNFSGERVTGTARVRLHDAGEEAPLEETTLAFDCAPGEVRAAAARLTMPVVDTPKEVRLVAELPATTGNSWDLWAMPAVDLTRRGVYLLTGLDYDEHDRRLDKEEAGYSCGFGIPARRWRRVMPEPTSLGPRELTLDAGAPIPDDARFIVAHRLTEPLLRFLEQGGDVLLLASKARGGVETKYLWLFGQVPFVIEEGPFGAGDSDWLLDGLSFDLNFANGRAIPVAEQGLIEYVEPLVRLAYTHDKKQVELHDQILATRVGAGTLIVSALDHACPVGSYLLDRLIHWCATGDTSRLPALPRTLYEHIATGSEGERRAKE